MFKKETRCNMTNTESYIRGVISIIIFIAAYKIDSILLAVAGLILFHSAIAKFCFMYSLLKINERFSLKSYYISQLPKYNRYAVYIFNINNKKVYENDIAESYFKHIESLYDINIANIEELINENRSKEIVYSEGEKTFQINLQGIQEDKILLIYVHDVTKIIELNDAIEETQREIIYTMGEIGETRSKETGHHVKRVALYSEKLALLYGLSHEEAELLKTASPMHDIGKVGIADEILNAPRKLTAQEFEIMKTHAQIGYEMLRKSNQPIIKAAAIVAQQHHEKYDGSGYPRGLKGDDIHIYGRITAIADVFDALGSNRVYKKAWPLQKILNYFNEQKGRHFDPKLVELFEKNLDDFLAIRDKYKDAP